MKQDTVYGRLKVVAGQSLSSPHSNEKYVYVNWSLATEPPVYANGNCLEFVINDVIHQIFNPFKYRFNLNGLISSLKSTYGKDVDSEYGFKVTVSDAFSLKESG